MYLDVIVRVPVGVVDDDGVGGGQVDAQAPGPGGQQEGKLGGAGSCGRNHTGIRLNEPRVVFALGPTQRNRDIREKGRA